MRFALQHSFQQALAAIAMMHMFYWSPLNYFNGKITKGFNAGRQQRRCIDNSTDFETKQYVMQVSHSDGKRSLHEST